MLNKRRKTHHLIYKNRMILQLNKLESPLILNALWQFLVEIGPMVLMIKKFNFVNVFFYFVIICPCKRTGPFILNKLESLPKDALSRIWLKFVQCFWKRKIFKFRQSNFCYFVIISPWKKAGPFIRRNLNSLHPRMLYTKFGWNWSGGSGEEDILNFVNLFLLFRTYLPLEKVGALHLNTLESPLTKNALCSIWLKLTQWFFTWAFSSGELKTVSEGERGTDRDGLSRSKPSIFITYVLLKKE